MKIGGHLFLVLLFGCSAVLTAGAKPKPNQPLPPVVSLRRAGPPPSPSPGRILGFTSNAPDDKSVLILSSTKTAPTPYDSASVAVSLGYTVVLASDSDWRSMSTANFKSYSAIVLGDPQCVAGTTSPIKAAEDTINTWGAALDPKAGNVILLGTDFEYHSPSRAGALELLKVSIAKAAAVPEKTGLVLSLSCYYFDATVPTKVPVLSYFGDFYVTGVPGCFDAAHVVKGLPGLTDASLSDWGCSVHEIFTRVENLRHGFKFEALAIAKGNLLGSKDYGGVTGTPYILGSVKKITEPKKSCAAPTSDSCDFYFAGYNPDGTPPTFSLGSTTGPDHSISSSIVDIFTGKNVVTANTNDGFLYGKLPTGSFKKGENKHSFYGNRDKVFVQVFNAPINPDNYRKKCIVLPITSAQLANGVNLNPRDGFKAYDESRRCVIFKTA